MEHNNKPGAENLLQVCDIYKSFGDNAVLKGMTLSLKAGEVLSLIGGNGAGKSTLMKIIMGIYTHDSGKVYVDGKEMTAGKTTEALSSGVYMVPQEPLLFPNMSVEENILIGFTRPQAEEHRLEPGAEPEGEYAFNRRAAAGRASSWTVETREDPDSG